MKKIIVLLFSWCILSSAFAQDGYVKHVFEIGRGDSYFQGWKARGMNHVPFTDGGYTFFLNKNIGFRLTYHVNTKEIVKGGEEKYKYLPPNSVYYNYKYIDSRRIFCKDALMTYRLNHKRHNLWGSIGLSWRKDMSLGLHKTLSYVDFKNYTNKSLGYVASISYQYRMFRNVGISGELLFRQSKDIPNTFTYGLRLSYLIWNKKKEKESK